MGCIKLWQQMTAHEWLKQGECEQAITIIQLKEKVPLPEPMPAEEYIDKMPGEDLDNLTVDEVLEMAEWKEIEEETDETVEGHALQRVPEPLYNQLEDAFITIATHVDRDGARV